MLLDLAEKLSIRAFSINIKKAAVMFDMSLDTFCTVLIMVTLQVSYWNNQENAGHVITWCLDPSTEKKKVLLNSDRT